MDTVAQLRAFPHSKKLRKSGRQRASFLNRSSRVEEVAFCPPCSLGSSNKCTRVPALCRGLVLSLMYKEETTENCICRTISTGPSICKYRMALLYCNCILAYPPGHSPFLSEGSRSWQASL